MMNDKHYDDDDDDVNSKLLIAFISLFILTITSIFTVILQCVEGGGGSLCGVVLLKLNRSNN